MWSWSLRWRSELCEIVVFVCFVVGGVTICRMLVFTGLPIMKETTGKREGNHGEGADADADTESGRGS